MYSCFKKQACSFHILPDSIQNNFLVFQGAPDIIINKLDALCAHGEIQDEQSDNDDEDESQHSGRIQVGHQMMSLKPSVGSFLHEKVWELVGALSL